MTKKATNELKRSVLVITRLLEQMEEASFHSHGKRNFEPFKKSFELLSKHLEHHHFSIKEIFTDATVLPTHSDITGAENFNQLKHRSQRNAIFQEKSFNRFIRDLDY